MAEVGELERGCVDDLWGVSVGLFQLGLDNGEK